LNFIIIVDHTPDLKTHQVKRDIAQHSVPAVVSLWSGLFDCLPEPRTEAQKITKPAGGFGVQTLVRWEKGVRQVLVLQ
jgi:hypothetical protein